MTACWNQ